MYQVFAYQRLKAIIKYQIASPKSCHSPALMKGTYLREVSTMVFSLKNVSSFGKWYINIMHSKYFPVSDLLNPNT